MNTTKTYRLFLFVAVVYTFFNGWLLPEGLYYTTLLTPFFFISLVKLKGLRGYACFLALSLLLAVVQWTTVEYVRDYLVSFLLLQTLAIFVLNTYLFFATAPDMGQVFKRLAVINIVLVAVALLTLPFPPLRPLLWYLLPISPDIPVVPRLKLFTSEASYYSLVLVPVFAYYALKKILLRSRYNLLFLSLGVALLLSFSLGVLATSLITFVLLLSFNANRLKGRVNLTFLVMACWLLIGCGVALYCFYRHNPLFARLENIYTGKDTSARGRMTDSFFIAWHVAKLKSLWWGVGLGQLKFIGKDFTNYFYAYSNIPVTRIHNSVAETFCFYGWVGLALRFFTLLYLFFRTKVWDNYYRQFLFVFMFIYQFTGSYLFNPAEYVLWILAFSPAVFSLFNRESFTVHTAPI